MATYVNLCFDDVGTQQIASLQKKLSDEGISDYADWLNYPPHLTLARFDDVEFFLLEHALEWIQVSYAPSAIELSSIGMFAGAQPVVWLAPAVNTPLLETHKELCYRVRPFEPHPNYQPERWTPHVTLAAGLEPERAVAATTALLPIFQPITAMPTRVEIVTFPPASIERSYPIGLADGI